MVYQRGSWRRIEGLIALGLCYAGDRRAFFFFPAGVSGMTPLLSRSSCSGASCGDSVLGIRLIGSCIRSSGFGEVTLDG